MPWSPQPYMTHGPHIEKSLHIHKKSNLYTISQNIWQPYVIYHFCGEGPRTHVVTSLLIRHFGYFYFPSLLLLLLLSHKSHACLLAYDDWKGGFNGVSLDILYARIHMAEYEQYLRAILAPHHTAINATLREKFNQIMAWQWWNESRI